MAFIIREGAGRAAWPAFAREWNPLGNQMWPRAPMPKANPGAGRRRMGGRNVPEIHDQAKAI
jgi:hypothetical protein